MKGIGEKLGRRIRKIHLHICKRQHNRRSLQRGSWMEEWRENESKTPPSQQGDKAVGKTPQIGNSLLCSTNVSDLVWSGPRVRQEVGSHVGLWWISGGGSSLISTRQQRMRGERSQRKPLGWRGEGAEQIWASKAKMSCTSLSFLLQSLVIIICLPIKIIQGNGNICVCVCVCVCVSHVTARAKCEATAPDARVLKLLPQYVKLQSELRTTGLTSPL